MTAFRHKQVTLADGTVVGLIKDLPHQTVTVVLHGQSVETTEIDEATHAKLHKEIERKAKKRPSQ